MKAQINYALMLIVVLFMHTSLSAQSEIYIAPNGNDSNSGTINSPLKTLIGARNKSRSTGAKTILIKGGRYFFDQTCTLGSQDNGLKISGYGNEKVIFDGSKSIDPKKFTLLKNLNGRLKSSVAGKIYTQVITDNGIKNLLKENSAQISLNDELAILARYPNLGYGHIKNNSVLKGFETSNTKGSPSAPKGPKFSMIESVKLDKWDAELKRNKGKAFARGYISAEWFKEDLRLHSAGGGTVRFMDGTRYGIETRFLKEPKRFFVSNMLYELDQPGEWYYDDTDSRLYIYPKSTINDKTTIGVWAGPQLIKITDSGNITIEKITIQNLGKGKNGDAAINVIGNSNKINIKGVTFRFIGAPLTPLNFLDKVRNSGATSCDFYDNQRGVRLYGGGHTPNSVTYGRNFVENCHFTMINAKDFYGNAAGIRGAGNVFRNNLVHNMNGQPITHAGVDHLLERNEIFNVGIEEGDGGAIYTGNSTWTYGNKIRHNFVHHLISVPGLLGRAAFFSDDFDGGETVEENILFRAGHESIKMNGGGGHTVYKNILLECYTAIKNGTPKDNRPVGYYKDMMEFIDNDPLNNSKNNYIGRMLKAVGKPDWQSNLNSNNWRSKIDPWWEERYPTFKFKMNAYFNRKDFFPYETRFYDNLFYNNKFKVVAFEVCAVRGSKDIGLNIFKNPENLDFSYSNRPSFAPNIPFNNIGLYKDSYRCAVPNKNVYRKAIKQRFKNTPVYGGRYDPKTVNSIIYYNSGKAVFETIPCSQNLPEPTEFRFDMGTASSPVWPNYIQITQATQGASYGWPDNSSLDSVEREENQARNNLNRDLVFSSKPRVFETKVTNGNWEVLITFGDQFIHDKIQVKAENVIQVSDVNTGANQFVNRTFVTKVSDGKLSLEFSDQGGSDPNWVVNRVILTKTNKPATNPNTGGNTNPDTTTYIAIPGTIQVENFVAKNGDVKAENTPGGGRNLGFIKNNNYTEYNIDVTTAGTYTFSAFASSNGVGGKIVASVGGANLGTVTVPVNNAWHDYNNPITGNITLASGKQKIRLTYTGSAGFLFNFDRAEFTLNSSAPTPTPTPPVSGGNGDTFYIVNRQTGLKLAPQNSNDGAELIQVATSNTTDIAKWTQVASSNGFFYLKNVSTGKYFRPATDSDGAKLEQRPSSWGGNYTQWEKINSSNGYFYLKNRQSKLYFRPNTEVVNSTMVQRPTSYAGNYTQWKFESASGKSLNSNNNLTARIYPNPTSGIVNINVTYGNLDSVIVYDINGQKKSNNHNGNTIDLNNLEAGIYFIKLLSTEGFIITERIIKK